MQFHKFSISKGSGSFADNSQNAREANGIPRSRTDVFGLLEKPKNRVDPDFLSHAHAIDEANGTTLAFMIAIQKQDEHFIQKKNAELLRILSRTRRRPTDAEKFEVRKQLLLKIIESLVSDTKRS